MSNFKLVRWILLSASVFLVACNNPAREDLLAKVQGVSLPEEIVVAIGPADDIVRNGAQEYWRYSASGGDLCFMVAGNIALRMGC